MICKGRGSKTYEHRRSDAHRESDFLQPGSTIVDTSLLYRHVVHQTAAIVRDQIGGNHASDGIIRVWPSSEASSWEPCSNRYCCMLHNLRLCFALASAIATARFPKLQGKTSSGRLRPWPSATAAWALASDLGHDCHTEVRHLQAKCHFRARSTARGYTP